MEFSNQKEQDFKYFDQLLIKAEVKDTPVEVAR